MGRFIISRSIEGDRFILQSNSGRLLAVSKTYATLDACKKGIASLIVHVPIMPVRDRTTGERGPNPKCEIVAEGAGFVYLVKSANGKIVIRSGVFATKKACLRAIAMLRHGVADYEIFFSQPAGLTPLVMKPPSDAAASPKNPTSSGIEMFEKSTSLTDFFENSTSLDDECEYAPWQEDEKACRADVYIAPVASLPQEEKMSDNDKLPIPETKPVTVSETARIRPQAVTPRLIRLAPQTGTKKGEISTSRREKEKVGNTPPAKRGILKILFKKQ